MSKMIDYLDASVGYDSSGLPASSIQFTFGTMPFSMSENENINDVVDIETVCQTDAIVDIKFQDEIVMVSFDFATETSTLVEFAEALSLYQDQRKHVTETLRELTVQYNVALENEDEKEIEDLELKMRTISIPFMLPTIVPVAFDGTVRVGFDTDPKFIFYTSDNLNQLPTIVTMIFSSSEIFCEDEIDVYREDAEAEIREEQEEMWYAQEERRMEEEAYREQYGYNSMDELYDDYDQSDSRDNRLKGVRGSK